MIIRIKRLPIVFLVLAILGALIGWRLEPWIGWRAKRPQIVLLGSGNVHPFVEVNVPDAVWDQMEPLWIDEGSGDALMNAFSVFNFGNSVGVDAVHRVGFLAMSSNGARSLETIFANPQTSADQQEQNWFLAIVIAKQPLVLFYRDVPLIAEALKRGSLLPPELGSVAAGYAFVDIGVVRDIIERPELPQITRYFPGENSGTRTLFEKALATSIGGESRVNWAAAKDIREVPDFLEDLGILGDQPAFLELASEPQGTHLKEPSKCESLAKARISTALICMGTSGCDHVIPANYTVVFKLERVSGMDPYKFRIPNPSECKIAQVFAPANVTKKCLVDNPGAVPIGHVITLSLPKRGLPDYLRCKGASVDHLN